MNFLSGLVGQEWPQLGELALACVLSAAVGLALQL